MYYPTIWKNRTEDDVLNCLEEAYRNAGYDFVLNVHKHDRAHEKGVDIEIQKIGEKIHLQLKIKPKKKDIPQLKELSHSSAKKRIYVHIEKPVVNFKNEMSKLEGVIEFWDDEKLHEFLILNHSTLYLRFLFLNCGLVRNISEMLFTLFSCSDTKPQKLQLSNLEDWWDLKDRAVKLHTSLEYLAAFWKEPISKKDAHDVREFRQILESIFFSFKLINSYSCNDLIYLIKKMKKECPQILSEYINDAMKSSLWIGMDQVRDQIGDKKQAMGTIEEWVLPLPDFRSEYFQINNYLERLHRVSEAVEVGVDLVFKEFVEGSK